VEAAVPEPPSQAWRLAFATAVIEVATNIMRHAYPSQVADRGLSLHLRVYADQVVASLQDHGIPLPAAPVAGPPPTGDTLDLAEGGYGLALARACVDVLDYSRTPDGTNCWRLVKRLLTRAPDLEQADAEGG
jgi:anti-sigma regulatory factor (Ser/Thr protein kinase)